MVFLLIKFFAEITYRWITVTQPLLQQPHFHPSLCPTRAWGLEYMKKDFMCQGVWQLTRILAGPVMAFCFDKAL
jgi:hypothetical protein